MSNMAMTIKVEAPDLVAALMRLAAAVNPDPNILTPDTPRPQMPAPAPAPIAPPTPVPPVAVPQGNVTPPVAAPVPPAAPLATTMPPAPAAAPVPPVAAPAAPPAAPPAPAPAPAAPAVPVTTAPTYTLDQIAKAGASLVDAGKMEPLLALLSRYGVQAVTQLAPEHYGAFATELRALGAQI